MVNVWWVNQGQTFRAAHSPEVLWAAYRDLQGNTQPSWDALEDLAVDDVVLHYADGFIRGSSRVTFASEPATRPREFRDVKHPDPDPGRRAFVDYTEWDVFVPLASIPLELRSPKPHDGSPFSASGKVIRAFLFPLTEPVYRAVFEAAGLSVEGGDRDEYFEKPLRGELGETYLFTGSTDGTAVVRTRREQGPLRRLLFGNSATESCELCGKHLPVSLLHAAHIKNRAACSPQERVDWPNVAMRACLLGCDALFEEGLVLVDETGHIQGHMAGIPSAALAAAVGELEGTQAPAFSEGRRAGFAWHRKHNLGPANQN